MASTRVSVICIFFNAERFIGEAVDSVLHQSFDDFELIMSDDGSTDSSTAIALDYAKLHPSKIRYVQHRGHANRGMSATRNLGVREASGEFIAFIDSDDVWRPEKLSEQVAIMETHREVGVLCGAVNYWSSWSGGIDRLVPTGHRLDRVTDPLETLLALYPLGSAHAACPSDILVRREVALKHPFEDMFTGPAQMYEDQAFFAKAYLAAPAYFSSRVWTNYRQHAGSCVSVVRESGLYEEVRRKYLNWLESYLADINFSGKRRVLREIRQAKWDLEHPFAGALRRTARRFLAPPPRLRTGRTQAGGQRLQP